MTPKEDYYPSRTENAVAMLPRLDPVVYSSKTPTDGILDEESLAHYEEHGYLLMHELFSPAEVSELKRLVDSIASDPNILASERAITELDSGELRSVFQIHALHPHLAEIAEKSRLVEIAKLILGGEVYIHQSRLNMKPGFHGKEFFWHSDFETWHTEDGMPRMRALSCSILLTDNHATNGALMLMPGSHKTYVSCAGKTPKNNYQSSLQRQQAGIPDDESLRQLSAVHGVVSAECKAGSVLFFDCNIMHGSNSNITAEPRSNLFFVYNHIENRIGAPYCGQAPRPEFVCSRNTIKPI